MKVLQLSPSFYGCDVIADKIHRPHLLIVGWSFYRWRAQYTDPPDVDEYLVIIEYTVF